MPNHSTSSREKTLENIPAALRRRRQWVGFKLVAQAGGKPRKIPVVATDPTRNASSTDASTWSTFPDAAKGLGAGHYDAIAYALDGDAIGIDLDGSQWVIDGEPTEKATAMVDRCGSYSELSVSGKGIHVLLRGTLAKAMVDHSAGIEVYTEKRFFICTGKRLDGTPATVKENQAAIDDLVARFFPKDGRCLRDSGDSRDSRDSRKPFSAVSAVSETPAVVLEKTLPKKKGERNAAIFRLARGLKFDAGMADAPLKDLRPLVRQWHTMALPIIGTLPFDDTWSDFLRAWPRAKFPLRADIAQMALAQAKASPLPTDYESPAVNLLLAICRELSALSNGRFFLSSHVAGRLSGVEPRQAYRWLSMFIADGYIAATETGNEHRATRYHWLGTQEVTTP